MINKKRIVIIGATSSIAEHCARLWLQKQPLDLTLVGRNIKRLERVAKDLKVRSPQSEIRIIQTEFLDPEAINTTVRDIAKVGHIDIALIAHGSLPEQFKCQNNLKTCHQAIEINAVSPVIYAEAFAKIMEKTNQGTLAIISSVAGDRGRKSNYVYGAAKGLITRYAQGLQHRFADTGVKIVLIKPGPTDTPMTSHLKATGTNLASVEEVARQIVEAIEAGKKIVYTPKKWSLIMMVIRHIPNIIFNKLNI